MGITRKQFDDAVKGLNLTPEDLNYARRQFFQNTIAPALKGKGGTPETKQALLEWGVVQAPQVRSGSLVEGAKQRYGDTLTGMADQAITGKRRVAEDNAIQDNPLSIAQEAIGGVAMDLLDPVGLAIDAVTAKAGSKMLKTPVAKQGLKRLADIGLSPVARRGAVMGTIGATSGATQGGLSAGLQGHNEGEINPMEVAKSTAVGIGIGALGGIGAKPAATKLRDRVRAAATSTSEASAGLGEPKPAPKPASPLALPPTPMEAELRARGFQPKQIARHFREQAKAKAQGPVIEAPPIRKEQTATWQGPAIDLRTASPVRETPSLHALGTPQEATAVEYPRLGMIGAQAAPAPNAIERELMKSMNPKKQPEPMSGLAGLRLQLTDDPPPPEITDPMDALRLQLSTDPTYVVPAEPQSASIPEYLAQLPDETFTQHMVEALDPANPAPPEIVSAVLEEAKHREAGATQNPPEGAVDEAAPVASETAPAKPAPDGYSPGQIIAEEADTPIVVFKAEAETLPHVGTKNDPRFGERGMAQPLDNSPILKVIEGGTKKAQEAVDKTVLNAVADNIKRVDFNQPATLRTKASPDAVRMLGEDARNLKGEAARVVNEIAHAEQTRRPASPDAIAQVEPHEFLNLKKFDISDGEKDNLARLVQESVAETGGNSKKVTFADIRKEAAQIHPGLIAQLRPQAEGLTLHPAVRQAARDRLNALNTEAFKIRSEVEKNRNRMSPQEIEQQNAIADRLERDAKGLIDVLYPTRSQDGRNLAYHRMMAENSFDADYWLSRARRAAGGALKDDQHSRIAATIARGDEAMKKGDTEGVRQSRIDLARALMKLERSTPLEVVSALRKVGMLTGVKTQARNLMGNAGFALLEEISRIPASFADLALSAFTDGRRSVSGANLDAMKRSSQEAATRGLKEALQVLRHGATEEQLARLDLRKEINSGSRVLDTYINTVFRLLGAGDRVFKSYAYRRSIEDQARVLALNAKAGNVQAFARRLADKPTEAMIAQAIADAEFATFNNRNALAEAVQRFKSGNQSVKFVADMEVPFVNTPTNIIARVLDYAGVGAALKTPKTIKGILSKSLTADEQREFAQALGRGATGAAMILLGIKLAEAGVMTGTYQSDPGEKGLNEVANRPAGAIKIGGKWHQIGALSPWGNLLIIGATIARDGADLSSIAAIGVKTALDQPFLQGADQVMDLAKDPGKAAPKVAADIAGSFVPTLVSDAASLGDDKQRDAEGIAEGIKRRVPGLRNQLPAKQDALGREIESDPANAINPFMSKEAKEDNDPTIRELVRLGVGLTKPQEFLTIKGEKRKLTPEEHRELTKLVGERVKERLDKLMTSVIFLRAEDEEKKDLIEKAIQRERGKARIQMMLKLK